jgi:quercetin dioxygenase-like cupin family protein
MIRDAMASNSGYRWKGSAATSVCFIAHGLCAVVAAQVPVHLEPRHPVAFENEKLRVLNVNIEAGDTTLDHVHAYDIAVVCISGCKIRTRPLGGDWGDWSSRTPGQVSVNSNAGHPIIHSHQAGNGPYHVISIENLRQGGWSQDAPASALAPKLINQARAFQIYDVRLGAGDVEAYHLHTHPVVAIVVSGDVMVDGKDHRPLKGVGRSTEWAVIPAGTAHGMANRGATEAHIIEIEVR